MTTAQVTIKVEAGLHARPATQFVNKAKAFKSTIMVHKNGKEADAKKFLQILRLSILKDEEIMITADGKDEKEAVRALLTLVRNDFVE